MVWKSGKLTVAAPHVPSAPQTGPAELQTALLNALIMPGGNWVWRRSILPSIFISEVAHQHTLIIFMNSAATDAAEAAELRFGCSPSPAGSRGGLYGMCVFVCLCARSRWISVILPR